MRQLKFRRAYFNYKNDKFEGFSYWGSEYDINGIPTSFTAPSSWSNAKGKVDQQFTGLKDKSGKDIYEGDIFRIEENATEVDEVDRVFYVVIVWVKEWCMFCSLLVESEYFDYTDGGINALDEPMFWTYTLEDTNSRKHFLCGNIFETPELLQNL